MISQQQHEILLKGINAKRIAKRQGGGGKSLSYLEAWDVKAHLIRIFGFGEWSWDVLSAELMFDVDTGGKYNVGYKVIGQLRIHATGAT